MALPHILQQTNKKSLDKFKLIICQALKSQKQLIMKKNKNLHTTTDGVPQTVKNIRKVTKLVNLVSTTLATTLVTKLFCMPVKRKIGSKQNKFYQSGTTEELLIRGYKIRVFKKGSGKAVYVAHGWNSYGYEMRHVVEALVKKGYQVIMPDMPCHGRSSGTFVDQIEMSKVISTILLHYNAQTPIEQIVTYSWGGTATLLALDQIRKQKIEDFNIKKMVSISMPACPNAIMDIFIKLLDLPKEVAKRFRRNIELVANKDGRSLRQAFPVGLPELLEPLSFEYLLLHGSEDEAINCSNCKQLAELFPGIQTLIFDGLGHIDIIKNQAVINEVIHHLQKVAIKTKAEKKALEPALI